MFRLVYNLAGKEHTYRITGDRVSIGRMGDNDLILPDHTVSRRHAEILKTLDEWHIRDLDSRNGMRLNDTFVKESVLVPGDVVGLGAFMIRFEEEPQTVVEMAPSHGEMPLGEGTIIRSIEEIQSELQSPKEMKTPPSAETVEVARLTRVSRILAVLSEVSRTLIVASDLESLLEKIMEVIFEQLPAQRGVILLHDPVTGQLVPRAVRQAETGESAIQISSSITNKAFQEGVAILTHDAQMDDRFTAGESIRFLGIRSALCVPLKLEREVLGLIYVDTPLRVKAFDDFDLDLLSALSGYAAVGIQQAELRAAVESERRAKARLERYHSPSVVDRILSARESVDTMPLQVREIEGTVLFADLVGFTALTENMPPGQVARMLNACFSRMTDVIFNHDGTLDKFIGDAIMAIFGAPIPCENHAVQAVQCALDMRSALEELNEANPGEIPLVFRMGINTGPAVAGDIGSVRRMEYTVLGTTVNVASRLESEVAKPGQVVVGESTYTLLKDAFAFERIGLVKVKGLTRPQPVYEVIGPS